MEVGQDGAEHVVGDRGTAAGRLDVDAQCGGVDGDVVLNREAIDLDGCGVEAELAVERRFARTREGAAADRDAVLSAAQVNGPGDQVVLIERARANENGAAGGDEIGAFLDAAGGAGLCAEG